MEVFFMFMICFIILAGVFLSVYFAGYCAGHETATKFERATKKEPYSYYDVMMASKERMKS